MWPRDRLNRYAALAAADALPLRVDAYLALNAPAPDGQHYGDWYADRDPGTMGIDQLSVAFMWSTMTLVTGVATLLFACYGAGGRPSLLGVVVALSQRGPSARSR